VAGVNWFLYLLSAVPADTDSSADRVDGEPKKSGMSVSVVKSLLINSGWWHCLFQGHRAANNFSFLKGHTSDQVSILVGQIEMWSDIFFIVIIFKMPHAILQNSCRLLPPLQFLIWCRLYATYSISFARQFTSAQGSFIHLQNQRKSLWNNYFLSLCTYYLVKINCPDIMSDQSYDFVGHRPILVGHCLMTSSYLQLLGAPNKKIKAEYFKCRFLFS